MENKKIDPSKITRPFQLLAAWLVGLISIDGIFLVSASQITVPSWIPTLLVVASVVNVPLFLFCIFLLQTKFRPEMQEDEYYSEYLKIMAEMESKGTYYIEAEKHSKILAESLMKELGSSSNIQKDRIEEILKETELKERKIKGALFDTNRSYDENAIWEMVENSRVAAYGDSKYMVEYLNQGDIVFFSHKGYGLICAAEVNGPINHIGEDEQYRDVKFLTPVPKKEQGINQYMSFNQVSIITGKTFFWARTIKVPYLNRSESQTLLKQLNSLLNRVINET